MDPLLILVLTALWLHNTFPLPILALMVVWLYSPLPLRILFLLILWLFSRGRNRNTSTSSQGALTSADRGLDTTSKGATASTDDPEIEEHCFYEMEKMDSHHALKLFCHHAFEKDRPPPELHDISNDIVCTIGGLPLLLQVIGSSLYNQDEETWKCRLEKLKKVPHKDVQQTLMISYEALEYEQQQIFLDIACLFDNEEKTDPIYFWKACDFFPDSTIKILERRSLVKVDGNGTLRMHDQLRDLGRAIVQQKTMSTKSQISAIDSRLWSPECALDALRKKDVDQHVEALKLGTLDADCCFFREEFAGAVNLRFLQLQGGNLEGDFKDVFQQLRWLTWFECPLRFKANDLSFKNLVVLKLSGSQIREWGEWDVFKEAKNLKVLHLQACQSLNKTPDFSSFLEVERLIIRDCYNLEEIDTSINKLKQLKYLEISASYVDLDLGLRQYSPCDLKSLRELKIENVEFWDLHPSIGELANLKLLYLRGCSRLQYLPSSIGKLTVLEVLDISRSQVEELPDSVGDLKELKILRMNRSGMKQLPETIGNLESLEEFSLSHTGITWLPETIGNLRKLKFINVSKSRIKMLPEALVKLEKLERLEAAFCRHLDGNLPEEIGKLPRLSILYLLGTNISRVPTTINQLSHLHELSFGGLHDFQELSKLPTSLRNLTVSSSTSELCRVPDLASMTNLVRLVLRGGTRSAPIFSTSPLRSHQARDLASMINFFGILSWDGTLLSQIQTTQLKWLARLQKLKELTLDLPDLVSPPTELSSLSRLQSLEMRCFHTQSLPHLPSNLGSLRLNYVISIDWQLFSSLNNMFTLTLDKCWLKEINVDCLDRLHYLGLYSCEFLERLSNLSSLKELQKLEIFECRRLVDIEGLGELKYLRSMKLTRCDSIQQLPNLLRSKKLEELRFEDCDSLKSMPEVDEQAPCHLRLLHCPHFRNFSGPYSGHHRAIRHNCLEETLSEESSDMPSEESSDEPSEVSSKKPPEDSSESLQEDEF